MKFQRLIDCLVEGSSWRWSYSGWIYNYLCNQCLSPLMLWVRISIRARCITLCDKVCQWMACRWFSPDPPVSSTNKTDSHDITEILLKVAFNTIKQTNKLDCLVHDIAEILLSLALSTNQSINRFFSNVEWRIFQLNSWRFQNY